MACAYDIENKICCVIDVDKFHANCYSYSGAVSSIHYLLRQAPYRVMWIGEYVRMENSEKFYKNISDFEKEEYLLGFSTIYNQEHFDFDEQDESYNQKVSFITQNNKLWNRISVWDISEEYFDWKNTQSVKYEGYLINHSKKLAVDLAEYYQKSKSYSKNIGTYAVDLIPPLTETGGGIDILFFDGLSTKTTENIATTWCGDLLQIVDELPEDYKIIDCCFIECKSRSIYCYFNYGINSECFIKDGNDLFSAVTLSIKSRKRISPRNIKAIEGDGYIDFTPILVP